MRKKIIYLDDEPLCLRLFEAAFGEEYDVRVAETPTQARALVSQGAPDVFICDQRLGASSGTDFLAEVAARCPSSYRVLLTGTAVLGGVLTEIGSGVVEAFVTKPWTEEGVRHLLARAEMRRLECGPPAASRPMGAPQPVR